jgi:hypothetical protein
MPLRTYSEMKRKWNQWISRTQSGKPSEVMVTYPGMIYGQQEGDGVRSSVSDLDICILTAIAMPGFRVVSRSV